MECRASLQNCAHGGEQLLPEITKEDLIVVGNNGLGYSMFADHFFEKNGSNLLGCVRVFKRQEIGVLT